MKTAIKTFIAACLLIGATAFTSSAQLPDKDNPKPFTQYLMTDSCTFLSSGRTMYSILEPGYQMSYFGMDGKDTDRLVVTVLNETKKVGNVVTRVVEERETINGKPSEISRNYFAFCKQTGSIYYFGEEVKGWKDGKEIDLPDAWIAGGENKPGVDMPGLALIGARFFQEMAPGVAMDRIEIISIGESFTAPVGTFTNCMRTEETSPLEPGDIEYKVYAPGVGLLQDENVKLIRFGFVKN